MAIHTFHVPLDIAHQILATFGITSNTKTYDRWVKPDGFDATDLWQVLGDSPFIFGIDWRGELENALEYVAKGLAKLNVELVTDFGESCERGYVCCGPQRARVAYSPVDSATNPEWVFHALQGIVPDNIEFRSSPINDGSDGWEFAVLPRDEWEDLERIAPKFIAEYFRSVIPPIAAARRRSLFARLAQFPQLFREEWNKEQEKRRSKAKTGWAARTLAFAYCLAAAFSVLAVGYALWRQLFEIVMAVFYNANMARTFVVLFPILGLLGFLVSFHPKFAISGIWRRSSLWAARYFFLCMAIGVTLPHYVLTHFMYISGTTRYLGALAGGTCGLLFGAFAGAIYGYLRGEKMQSAKR